MILLEKDYWEVQTTKNTGNGIFAKKDLGPGSVIGDYLGKVLRTSEIDLPQERVNLYLMYYHDQASIYPNLKKPGIHLLNHSCMPNCAFFTYKGHVLFFTLRRVFPGEELTVSYMLSPKSSFCDPCTHICKCSSNLCTGSMHLSQDRYNAWRLFQASQERKTKRKRITYNKDLPPLSSYPKSIPDDPIYSLFGTMTKPSKRLTKSNLPSTKELRKLIRETGQTLEFPSLKKMVIGVQDNNLVISESLT